MVLSSRLRRPEVNLYAITRPNTQSVKIAKWNTRSTVDRVIVASDSLWFWCWQRANWKNERRRIPELSCRSRKTWESERQRLFALLHSLPVGDLEEGLEESLLLLPVEEDLGVEQEVNLVLQRTRRYK
jgi:hypothetical protein